MVKNLPCSTGHTGLIPGQGTRIPHAAEQLSLGAAPPESACHDQRVGALQCKILHDAWVPQRILEACK